jgi:hypothetical protein
MDGVVLLLGFALAEFALEFVLDFVSVGKKDAARP